MQIETLVCEVCGPWERPRQAGRKPKTCPEHRDDRHRRVNREAARRRYVPHPRPLPEHGTATRYKRYGCRCDGCRDANAEEMRRYNARLRARGEKDVWQRRRERQGRFSIAHAARAAIYARDAYVCQICDRPVARDAHWKREMSATLDHIIPRSKGGTDDPENLRTAHRLCNSLRSDGKRTDAEVRALVTSARAA